MNISRRDLLRRIAGLGSAGLMWVSTRYVLGESTSPRRRGLRFGARPSIKNATIATPRTSTAAASTITSHRHEQSTSQPLAGATTHHDATSSTAGASSNTTESPADTTHHDATSTTAGSSSNTTESTDTTTHNATTSAPPAASLELAGNIGPVLVPAGSTVKIVGDINLKGDLVVEGLLTGVDTFTLEGNGYQILVQNGGRVDLAGVPKTGWAYWGDSVSGWQVGDRLAVAPTAEGAYEPASATWQGSWSATARPGSARDVALIDGRIARPEVANLSQTIRLQNLSRVMFHQGAGVQSLRWIRLIDCGAAGKLGFYPVHFHLNGHSSHGSLVEGVAVEGGKFRAFVPHGSHGITMRDCVAYRTQETAFWWDGPPDEDKRSAFNNSNDTTWDHCLALHVLSAAIEPTGFALGAGTGNRCVNSVASCITGKKNASGFQWPGHASQNAGGNVWGFANNVVHNNPNNGVYIWQNDGNIHPVTDLTIYNCKRVGFEHGAYQNNYGMNRILIQRSGADAVGLHAIGGIRYTDVFTDGLLRIHAHSIANPTWVEFTRCNFTGVEYSTAENQEQPSSIRFTDCGLTPAQFVMGGIHPNSLIQIVEGGVLTASWAGGAWS